MTDGRPFSDARVDEPVTADGVIDAAPADERPVRDEPTGERPDQDGRAADDAAEDGPDVAEPAADEPTAAEPDADEPTADEPGDEEPTAEPTADEPTDEPTADEPTTAEPTADEPTDEPVPLPAAGPPPARTSAFSARDTAPEPALAPAPVPAPRHAPEPEPRHVPPQARAASPMDVFPDQEEGRRWPRVVGIGAAVLLVLAAAYVGSLWLLGDRVPPGATVAGVDIGGLSAGAAVDRLDTELAGTTTEPIPVEVGERRTTLDPAGAGLELDAAATVDTLTGFGLEPARLWRHVFGAAEVEPVTVVDTDSLEGALEEVAGSLLTEPVDATLAFVDGEPVTTASATGVALDEDAAPAAVLEGWLTAARPLELPSVEVEPEVDDADAEAALDALARPLADAPVTVVVAEQRAELPVDVLVAAASFVPADGELEMRLDGDALAEAVVVRTTDLLTPAQDASFAFQDGVPVVVAGAAGSTIDADALASAVAAAATGGAERTARVELVEIDPAQSTAELEALGVTTRVSEFSTPLTDDTDRNHNLTLGASRVNGTLLRPGDVFSLTETIGPISAENGYRGAGVVVDGVLTKGVGGGLSQMGTTVYNVGFLAGLDDVEHQPHSYYFSRYPEGREATIYEGVLDVKIGNNTPYGVLLQSWVADGRLHVAAWSTPYWTVEHSTSGRRGVVAPKTVYNSAPGCIAQPAGNPGFEVTVTRRLLLDGVLQKEEPKTWRYRPQNAIVCGSPPSTAPTTPPTG